MLGETVLGNGTKVTGTHRAAQVVTSLVVSKWVISLPTSHQNLGVGGNRKRDHRKPIYHTLSKQGRGGSQNRVRDGWRALLEVVADPWY